ncbi:phage tail protein [Aliivibrio sifiae]|uniref:Phage tail protein n=1 Tax=Aliivibrio sifiae TaxID=566293 RepID=A0A2S7XHG1_9GAMM|nr:phage tail protein [Aliivibrio sifiae]PQJ93157.1 phage tail protein [Aliivibrio sifiae]GLR75993.1 hypothetical protein GCM10007855_28670 [Aliivibrio sifiae]
MNTEEEAPILPEQKPPWWMDGVTLSEKIKEPYFLANGIQALFQTVRTWLLFPLQQSDPLVCSLAVLNLLAWERDITRFNGEPLALYRKRVKFAFVNAKDAGEVAGFKRIFTRLGIGHVEVKERLVERDFDIISIQLSDDQLAVNNILLGQIIAYYGRTCRRYEFEVLSPVSLEFTAQPLHWEHGITVAELKE